MWNGGMDASTDASTLFIRGKVVGAVGISGPAGRIGLDHLAQFGAVVAEVSQALTDRLSFKSS